MSVCVFSGTSTKAGVEGLAHVDYYDGEDTSAHDDPRGLWEKGEDDFSSTARLFSIVFNSTSTMTTNQALAVVLGSSAAFGALVALAYYFMSNVSAGPYYYEDGGHGGGGYGKLT